jgi:hypothetical protein
MPMDQRGAQILRADRERIWIGREQSQPCLRPECSAHSDRLAEEQPFSQNRWNRNRGGIGPGRNAPR